jgi:putative addiction module antidote
MIMERKVIKIGDGAGIILPKKLLAHLRASVGDTLSVVVTADGIELAVADANFDHHMAAARDVMAKRKQALGELE